MCIMCQFKIQDDFEQSLSVNVYLKNGHTFRTTDQTFSFLKSHFFPVSFLEK